MHTLSSTTPVSDALIPEGDAVILHNPDEEIGFAGKHNTDLIPDIRLYDCRSVASIADHPAYERIVPVPADCLATIEATVHAFRDRAGLKGLITEDNLLPVSFDSFDTITTATLKNNEAREALQSANSVSCTMYTREIETLLTEFPHLQIPGNLALSEELNNKATAAEVCHSLGIHIPETEAVYCMEGAKRQYERLKERRPLPFVVKGARSASGFASHVVRTDEEFDETLDKIAAYFEPNSSPSKGRTPNNAIGIVIQEFVPDIVSSPGAAVIVGSPHHHVGFTEQVLNERNEHVGNVFPYDNPRLQRAKAEMEAMLEKAADYALQNGGEGTMLCADFVVREVSGQHVPYLVEFNMRMSAQYGGLAMVHHLFGEPEPSAHGYIGNISVPNNGGTPADVQQYFDFLQKEGVLPDGAEPHANAIYPMNFTIRGTVQGLMVAKSAAELQELRALATMQHSTSQSS